MNQKLYIVTGGIGKHAVFSSLINSLHKKDENKIFIMSSYPDLFKYHPMVEQSVSREESGFYDNVIVKKQLDVVFFDPYYSNFIYNTNSLITAWGKGYGLEKSNDLPDIYIDSETIEKAESIKATYGDFIIVQFSGGQSLYEYDPNKPFTSKGHVRDYPRKYAQELVNKIKENYPHLTIINYCMGNEATANLDNTISFNAPYILYVALLQLSKGFIAIDSSLQHFAANRHNNNVGVVLWGSTKYQKFGYERHYNIIAKDGLSSLKPLPNTLGDIYDKDGNLHLNNSLAMHYEPSSLMILVDKMINTNEEKSSPFNNRVEVNEKREVIIDEAFQNIIAQLILQSKNVNNQINTLLQTYQKSLNLDGKYILSQDYKSLIKVGK